MKIQRSTLQIGEEDHLQKGDIICDINGEQQYNKDKFQIISKLSSLSGTAEISILRGTKRNCNYTVSGEDIPYYNGIFAQNSIKLAMRRYETIAIKSNSDFAYAISERSSIEPAFYSAEEHNIKTSSESKKTTSSTTMLIMKLESSNYQIGNDASSTKGIEEVIETNQQLNSSNKARKQIMNIFKQTEKSILESKDIDTGLEISKQTEPSFEENWIFCNKNQQQQVTDTAIDATIPPQQNGSTYILNNSFTSPATNEGKTSYELSDIKDSTGILSKTSNSNNDSCFFYAEDHTNRTLTRSSCHSDRSMIQLNLLCCDIDSTSNPASSKNDDEKGNNRISEGEEYDYEEEECKPKLSKTVNFVTNSGTGCGSGSECMKAAVQSSTSSSSSPSLVNDTLTTIDQSVPTMNYRLLKDDEFNSRINCNNNNEQLVKHENGADDKLNHQNEQNNDKQNFTLQREISFVLQDLVESIEKGISDNNNPETELSTSRPKQNSEEISSNEKCNYFANS